MSELYIFARFHAREGCEDQVEQVLHAVLEPSRAEPGCLAIHAFRSTRDSRLFHIHSRWRNEATFEHHATLPHTALFVERMEKLIEHPFDVTRSNLIG
jgi:quinol monooxygenase YgiN